ncbi:MAG: hypothetical protein KGL31_12610 [candidate division NC10 bacterium]|nr:hypothetical protein [candidate division NC10 bacterium]MDE2322731.1 hypothetical protein [candidate division NC10 bacterium]
MALLRHTVTVDPEMGTMPENHYLVIHPLDDRPETKVDTESLGRMPMTRTVRISLLSLRAYLLVMGSLVAYQFIHLAGFFK